MSATRPIPIRFSPEILARIDACARKTGVGTRTAVVRMGIVAFLDAFEAAGGKPFQPPAKAARRVRRTGET